MTKLTSSSVISSAALAAAGPSFTTGTVVQFGVEMMPLCHFTSSAFTSGTTSGTSGSMRHAELSSITSAPALAAKGAK